MLILLEGLPGTSKSTNSRVLRTQFQRNGRSARWIHEEARPHPTLFFYEASLTHDEYAAFLQKYPHARPLLDKIKIVRDTTVGIDLLEVKWSHERFHRTPHPRPRRGLSTAHLGERSASAVLSITDADR